MKINPTCSVHQINLGLVLETYCMLHLYIHTHAHTHSNSPKHSCDKGASRRLLSQIRQLIAHSPRRPRKKCIFHWLCLCGAVMGRWLNSHRNVCNIPQAFNHFKGQSDKVINGPSGDVQGDTEARKQALECWFNSLQAHLVVLYPYPLVRLISFL